MTLVIDDAETAAVIHRLAERMGETPALAMKRAAEERLARTQSEAPRFNRGKVEELLAVYRAFPTANEHLTDDEIIGYDDNGIPR